MYFIILSTPRTQKSRINSVDSCSLGLHPIVYFYTNDGRHKPASFYAVIDLIIDFDKRNFYREFIKVRENFEWIILSNDYLVQQIVRKYRSASNAYTHVKDFYLEIINILLRESNRDEVITYTLSNKKFNYLSTLEKQHNSDNTDFSSSTKSAAFIREALQGALKCKICRGYLHLNSITIDHTTRKADGGSSNLDNAQLAHPYCNSTIKN